MTEVEEREALCLSGWVALFLWIGAMAWAAAPVGGEVKVQCSAHGATATATISPAGNDDGDRVHVSWHSPQRRIAPGQSVVFYDAADAYVLGGGIAG